MKILITGGAGYIGSILTPALLAKGYEVTVLDNFMFDQNSLMDCCPFSGFQVVRGDCRDEAVMKRVLPKADVVIPLAAFVGAPMCQQDSVGAQSTNLDAIRLLLSLRSPEQRIVFPTSNSGYGIGQSSKFCTEETQLRPLTLYGRTKVEAEKAILDAGNAITYRLATVFGLSPRMRLDLLVNDFVYRAVHDRAVVLFQAHFKRNYIHVRDVARAFLHALENFETMKDKPYNVGLDEANLSKLELCIEIKKQLPNFVYLEAPIGEDPDKRDYIVSNERIANTGFKPEWLLGKGITELIKGYAILRNNLYSNV
jgi:nucleoside-diphosphate-sugar epimerase